MPTTVEVALRVVRDAARLPTARQLHAAVVGAVLAPGDVESDAPASFSVWPLMVPDVPEPNPLLRVAWLPDSVPPLGLLEIDRSWRFGSLEARAVSVGAAHQSYWQLADGPGATTVRMDFLSPTYFSRSGPTYPLPDPLLILRNLVTRWNRHAPDLALDEQQACDLVHSLDVVDFDVHASPAVWDRSRPTGDGPPRDVNRLGFTGHLTVRLSRRAPRDAAALLGSLARFAGIGGVGTMTTHGMGACTVAIKEA